MRAFFHRLGNSIFKSSMRIFMPDLFRQMKAEGTTEVFGVEKREVQETDYIRVIDNDADVTIFAFSGLDVLYAGLARFEFQNVLKRLGKEANLVFVRDIHRLGFHLTPHGTPDGGEFFVEKINEVKAQLGASHNVAVGSSIGGSAAFYFGSRCQMQQLIIFGAAFTMDGYTKPSTALRTFFDFKKLFTEPTAYFELALVTMGAAWARKQLLTKVGEEKVGNPLQAYAEANPKPRITVFYGGTAWPDVAQAHMLKEYPTAHLNPLPTGRHNTPAFLKKHGSLGDLIGQEIRAALDPEEREALSQAV